MVSTQKNSTKPFNNAARDRLQKNVRFMISINTEGLFSSVPFS